MLKIIERFLKSNLLSDEVATFLRNQILKPELFPKGSYIREEKLASQLDISRGPVREALKTLAGEGLVKIIPRKGALVVDFSRAETEELWEIRYLMERAVFEKIIESNLLTEKDFQYLSGLLNEVESAINEKQLEEQTRIIDGVNFKFHNYIARISQKKYTVEILSDVYKKLRHAMMRVTPLRIEDFVEKHFELLANLRDGNFSKLVEDNFYSYFERRYLNEDDLIGVKKEKEGFNS